MYPALSAVLVESGSIETLWMTPDSGVELVNDFPVYQSFISSSPAILEALSIKAD